MTDKAKFTILNVDDDEASRYAVSRILRQAGFEVMEAANGAEALRLVKENPDLIILDINLPDMSGFEVCRQIKADPATALISVLHLTATYKDSQSMVIGLEGGADGYLTHPVEPPVLVSTVKALLRVRQAEAELQAAAREWRTTFDAIGDAICLLDLEGRVLRCNEVMTNLLGKPFDKIIGRTCWELVHGASEPIEGCPIVRMRETRRRESLILPMGERWLEVTADPLLDEDGDLIGAVHIMTDITARKRAEEALRESEENFRSLAENAFDGILIASGEGAHVYANAQLAEITGYSIAELLKTTIKDLAYPDEFNKVMERYIGRLEGKPVLRQYETIAVRKDGKSVPIELTATNTAWQGQPADLVFVRDITERKRAEEERRRLLAELEAKNRELESFVYSVSHDLRAPVVSLDGFSHLLYKDFYDQLGDQGQHYLDRIQANVSHMNVLTSELLELARIGQVVGPTVEIDVAVLLRETQEELAIKLEEAGVELVVQEPLPTVHADRTRIRQVFTNLIENAIKFRSQERRLRIEVGCQQEGGFYRFHVADNGIGIAPQYHELIFAPFRQLDAQTEGVGMGLALVKKIVEHHGGRVWVESEEGKGATFYFTLPNPGEG